jgi:hypothetical protein
MNPFPEEHDLIALFECEPTLADEDIPWFYNHLCFTSVRGNEKIECHIEPAGQELIFKWWLDNLEKINLVVRGIKGLEISMQANTDMLIASFGEENQTQVLKIRLKPFVSLSWEVNINATSLS